MNRMDHTQIVSSSFSSRNSSGNSESLDEENNEHGSLLLSTSLLLGNEGDFRDASRFRYDPNEREKRECENIDIYPSTLKKRRLDAAIQMTEAKIEEGRCCKRRCFQAVDASHLKQEISEVACMSNSKRRNVLSSMVGYEKTTTGDRKVFIFNGNVVCATFLCKAFRFSRHLQSKVKMTDRALARGHAKGTGNNILSARKDSIIIFLSRLADSTAGNMPDKSEQHLPFFKKSEVYRRYENEYSILNSTEPPSMSYFYHVWKKHCSSIKVRRVSRFTKCSTCEDLRTAILEASKPGYSTEDLLLQRKAHVDMVWRERMEYQKKAERAILNPKQFCSICVDGADQSAFGLPHFAVKTVAR